MIRYITGRLLLFIPTLIAISLLAFIISINAPGDPVERMVSSSDDGSVTQSYGQEKQKSYWRKKLGLDLPVFYFSIHSSAEPQLNENNFDKKEIESIKRLSSISGNSTCLIEFQKSRTELINVVNSNLSDSSLSSIQPDLLTLKYAASFEEINFRLNRINEVVTNSNNVSAEFITANKNVRVSFANLQLQQSRWKNYIPVINFHPINQYHRWVFGDGNWLTGAGAVNTKGIIRGDFGISYQTLQPVSQVISEKIKWSLMFAVLSVFLAYLVSIPIGVWSGANRNSRFDKSSSLILFILYSMPSFWVATLLLMTFANPDILYWFPASGIKPASGYSANSFFSNLSETFPYLILPLICYTYSSFAFLSRTTRVAMLDTMSQDYIRTANAKGLSKRKVVFKHAFRNSLLPLITIFANIFPAAIGGSVIIETIFSIPGMGFETIQSIHNQNYPMIVTIFTISGVLTVTGYLFSDILYAIVDPRITYIKKR